MADGFDFGSFDNAAAGPWAGGYSFPEMGGFSMPNFLPDFSTVPDFGGMPISPSPTFQAPAPSFNESFIPHNYLTNFQAPPPTAPQQQGQGLLGSIFGHQPSGLEIGLLGAGLLPLLMGTFGAFGNERPSQQQQGTQAATTTRTAPPAGPAENTALINALLGTFSPMLNPSLVEQAFQPQLGSLTQQAIEQAQRAGFHTSPLESPVAERIMGQGLADLQGQIAAAKLGQQQFASNLGANLLGTLQQGRLGQGTTTQTGNQSGMVSQLGGPSPLFGSAQQLSQMLGGFGGLLGGLAAYSKPQTQTLSGA